MLVCRQTYYLQEVRLLARIRKEKSEFGQYLVEVIKSADMSQADFIAEVGIAKPYFYDMLKSSPPPQDTLDKMLKVLDKHLPPDENRRSAFIDKAAKCRGEIPADINELIREHPEQWGSIRESLSLLLSAHV